MIAVTECRSCGAAIKGFSLNCTYCGVMIGSGLSSEQQNERIVDLQKSANKRELSAIQALELAELLFFEQKTEHAREYLRKAIDLDPDLSKPRVLLLLSQIGFNEEQGNEFCDQKEIDEHFEWLKTHHPDLYETKWLDYYFQAVDMLENRDRDRARCIQVCAAGVEEFPENYLLHTYYAMSLCDDIWPNQPMGDAVENYALALKHFQLSAELNPRFMPAVKNIDAVKDLLRAAKDSALQRESINEGLVADDPELQVANSCFPAHARVLTPLGNRAISSLSKGDSVLSISRSGGFVTRRVTRVLEHEAAPTVEVRFEGEGVSPLEATANHRILTGDGRWTRIDESGPVDVIRRRVCRHPCRGRPREEGGGVHARGHTHV